ncbi:MAG TPA: aromatic ring-hydroxylating dioxygenase subunit alpha [Candidatus Binataceae bacterium]|nr:aromatic ring-hydroxylating dioxygenase subunit alpha [Candidatus Binataceae bacterium]
MAPRANVDYKALVKDDRVHGSVYLDPQIFEDEIEKIFHQGWVYVGHTGEIPEPGDYRLRKIGRAPVIMVRDDRGKIRLLLNRCRHRAATVCQVEQGNAKVFRCAYHGWTYRNSGALAAVTYQDGYGAGFRKEDLGLAAVPRVGIYRGFVFGSLSPSGISLEQHLGRATEQLDLFVELSPEAELEVRSGVNKYSYPANWKLQLENAIDGYHPNLVHQSYFDAIQKRTHFKLDTFNGDSAAETRDLGNGHVMLDYRPYNKLRSGSMRTVQSVFQGGGQDYLDAMVSRYGKERTAEIMTAGGTHLLVFPNLILIGVQIRVVRPLDVGSTEVFLYPTLLKGVAQQVNVARLRGHEGFYGPAGGGAPDDLEMFARVQEGLQAQVDPWLLFTRGLHRQRHNPDGSISGQITDEVPQRGIWSHWKSVMAGQPAGRARELRQPRIAAAD